MKHRDEKLYRLDIATAISTCFRSHDREKRRVYDQRVSDVERGSFTPLSPLPLVV